MELSNHLTTSHHTSMSHSGQIRELQFVFFNVVFVVMYLTNFG